MQDQCRERRERCKSEKHLGLKLGRRSFFSQTATQRSPPSLTGNNSITCRAWLEGLQLLDQLRTSSSTEQATKKVARGRLLACAIFSTAAPPGHIQGGRLVGADGETRRRLLPPLEPRELVYGMDTSQDTWGHHANDEIEAVHIGSWLLNLLDIDCTAGSAIFLTSYLASKMTTAR
jgi:hypothetical protein